MMTGQPFTIHNSNIDANRNGVLIDPLPAGTYSGVGQNAITVENKGGRNGAIGPGSLQIDLRAGYRLRPRTAQTIDLFFEAFNITNEPNFANPTGDCVGELPRADHAGRRRVPAAVPGRREGRVLAAATDGTDARESVPGRGTWSLPDLL
jgi:hypothetical protein